MKTNPIKKLLKNIFAIVIIVIAFLGIIDLFRPNSFTLKVVTQPGDAIISVNTAHTTTGNFEMKLKRGVYTVKVEKEGYITDTRQIELSKNTDLSIDLISLFENSIDAEKIIPIESQTLSNPTNLSSGEIFGVSNENGNLIKMVNGTPTVIYDGVVKDYVVNNNISIVLDNSDLSGIFVLDLSSGSRRKIELKSFAPIIAVALSEDQQTIYFLAEFNIKNKTPGLYSVPINGGEPKKLTETRALFIEYLSNNILLLYEYTHSANKNVVHFFDTENEVELISRTTDTYKVSPDRNKLFLQTSSQISIIDTDNLKPQTIHIGESRRAIWKDNDTIIAFRNDGNGINYAVLTLDPLDISPFSVLVKGASVQTVYGIVGNKVYMQDYDNRLFSVDIPQ